MVSLFNKLTSKLSIKQIILTSIFLITLVITIFLGVFYFSVFKMNENQKSASSILKIERQNESILKILDSILETENSILMAKQKISFEKIEKQVFSEDNDIKLKYLENSKYELKYNSLLKNLEDDLQYTIEYQKDFFDTGFAIFNLKTELRKHLVDFKKEITEVHNIVKKIVKKTDVSKIKVEVNNLEKSSLKLYILTRDTLFIDNIDELTKVHINKLKDSYTNLLNNINKIKQIFKNKKAENLIKQFEIILINIDYLQYSITSAKQEILEKEQFLHSIKVERKKLFSIISNNMDKASALANQIINEKMKNSDTITKHMSITSSLLGLFSVLVLIFISIILISRVNKPLAKIIDKIKKVLEDKKSLSQDINVEYDDEYKKLVDAFNHMTHSIDRNMKKLKKRDRAISHLNKDLEKIVESRTKELTEQNQKITDLFNNAKQGFLSFGKDLIVDNEYSKECEKLLCEQIEGKEIVEFFKFENEQKKSFFIQTLIDIFNEENEIVCNSYMELLPKEFIINRRAISVEYKKLNDEKLMLILTNITQNKKLEQKIKKEQELLKMIVTIVSDTTQFYDLLNDYKEFDENKLNIFELNNSSLFNLSETYREVHTFKGLFAQLYMTNTVKKLHNFESELSDFIKDKNFSNDDLKEVLKEKIFFSWLDEDLEIIKSILGDSFIDEESVIRINEETVIQLEDKIKEYCETDKTHSDNYEDILFETQKLRSRTLYQALKHYPRLCKDLADNLGKQIYPFQILGDESIILPPDFKPFIKSLIHVFRNLIDHGIEDAETRIDKGKNENGTLVCSFRLEGDYLVILISDDGKGIDRNRIRKKVEELGLLSLEEFDSMSDERVFNLIFYESFSTKEKVTEVSGRGVGMAVVKNELVKIKGRVEVKSVVNEGATFIFKLPYGKKD